MASHPAHVTLADLDAAKADILVEIQVLVKEATSLIQKILQQHKPWPQPERQQAQQTSSRPQPLHPAVRDTVRGKLDRSQLEFLFQACLAASAPRWEAELLARIECQSPTPGPTPARSCNTADSFPSSPQHMPQDFGQWPSRISVITPPTSMGGVAPEVTEGILPLSEEEEARPGPNTAPQAPTEPATTCISSAPCHYPTPFSTSLEASRSGTTLPHYLIAATNSEGVVEEQSMNGRAQEDTGPGGADTAPYSISRGIATGSPVPSCTTLAEDPTHCKPAAAAPPRMLGSFVQVFGIIVENCQRRSGGGAVTDGASGRILCSPSSGTPSSTPAFHARSTEPDWGGSDAADAVDLLPSGTFGHEGRAGGSTVAGHSSLVPSSRSEVVAAGEPSDDTSGTTLSPTVYCNYPQLPETAEWRSSMVDSHEQSSGRGHWDAPQPTHCFPQQPQDSGWSFSSSCSGSRAVSFAATSGWHLAAALKDINSRSAPTAHLQPPAENTPPAENGGSSSSSSSMTAGVSPFGDEDCFWRSRWQS